MAGEVRYIDINKHHRNDWFEDFYRRKYKSNMNHAIDSTIKLIQSLLPEDLFGMVAFDDDVIKVQDIAHIDSENQSRIISKVMNISPGGCTNISQALQMARDMITPEHIEKYNCKIILLSDGLANDGITSADQFASLTLKYLQAGITVSSLGIGYDYDSEIMNAIATGGGGLFYHVEDLEKLNSIFMEELRLSNSIRAKNVKLILEIPDLIEVSDNMNDYKQSVKNRIIEVFIGDMVSSRKIYFEIKNNFVDKDVSFNIKVIYKSQEGEECSVSVIKTLKVVHSKEELEKYPKNEEVIKHVLDLIKYRTFRETSYLYEKGCKDEVEKAFANSIQYTTVLSTSYGIVRETLSSLESLNTAYSTESISREFAKNIYADSNRRMR